VEYLIILTIYWLKFKEVCDDRPIMEEQKNETELDSGKDLVLDKTRNDLHLPRRLFHMGSGVAIAIIYGIFLTREQVVSIIGAVACIVYILDQIRVNYPEYAGNFQKLSQALFRAEEQLKESAGVPYAMGILLTIISFPKVVAIIAILTLALADPFSAIIGIRYGSGGWVPGKSKEGSLAFFTITFLVTLVGLGLFSTALFWPLIISTFLIALILTSFELVPIRIDDNLTIPLFTGFVVWAFAILFSFNFLM
jgi:dolichol kinase